MTGLHGTTGPTGTSWSLEPAGITGATGPSRAPELIRTTWPKQQRER